MPRNFLKWQSSSVGEAVGFVCPSQLHAHTTTSCPASPLHGYSCLYMNYLLFLALPSLILLGMLLALSWVVLRETAGGRHGRKLGPCAYYTAIETDVVQV